jgi:hypothetical protein
MARHQYSMNNILPGAEGPAVQRYKAVIADIEDLEARGFGGPLLTSTFVNPSGRDGRFRDCFRMLSQDYWRQKRERLRFICALTPSANECRLWAAHLLWQHELPDLRWIAGWLVQHSGWAEDEIAKHVIWENKPGFSATVALDVLRRRRFAGFEHPYGRIDLRLSDDAAGGQGRVPPTEYFAEHSMTDETLIFESAYTRGRGWKPSAKTIQ